MLTTRKTMECSRIVSEKLALKKQSQQPGQQIVGRGRLEMSPYSDGGLRRYGAAGSHEPLDQPARMTHTLDRRIRRHGEVFSVVGYRWESYILFLGDTRTGGSLETDLPLTQRHSKSRRFCCI